MALGDAGLWTRSTRWPPTCTPRTCSTWLKADGALGHEALATVVTALFFGGLPAVSAPAAR